jgi:hypothetical protein
MVLTLKLRGHEQFSIENIFNEYSVFTFYRKHSIAHCIPTAGDAELRWYSD